MSLKLKKEGLDEGNEWRGSDCGGVRSVEGEEARDVVVDGELVEFVKSSVWKKSLMSSGGENRERC
jgi:hypothetical protein